MSDEYTPTTEKVRNDYAYDWNGGFVDARYELQFDRWLAAHDAATRTAALEEAAEIADGIDDDALNPSLIGAAIRAAKVAES